MEVHHSFYEVKPHAATCKCCPLRNNDFWITFKLIFGELWVGLHWLQLLPRPSLTQSHSSQCNKQCVHVLSVLSFQTVHVLRALTQALYLVYFVKIYRALPGSPQQMHFYLPSLPKIKWRDFWNFTWAVNLIVYFNHGKYRVKNMHFVHSDL